MGPVPQVGLTKKARRAQALAFGFLLAAQSALRHGRIRDIAGRAFRSGELIFQLLNPIQEPFRLLRGNWFGEMPHFADLAGLRVGILTHDCIK